jgi:flagellar motility protein MotE (MotC chaperone)
MADEEKKVPEDNEIKALDDDTPDDQEQQAASPGGLKGFIKRYLVWAIIGLAVVVLAYMIPQFFKGDKKPPAETAAEPAADSTAVDTENRDSLMQVAARPLELNELDAEELEELLAMRGMFDYLDTAAILEEMSMMGEVHEDIKYDSVPMTAADSVDTLNWIDREMQKIAVERDSLQRLKEDLQKLDKKVTQASNRLDQAEAARLTKLARLYDGMKPAEVASLFENLPDSVIVLILPKMKPAHASKILGLMKPKRAASISTKLITVTEQ